MRAKHVAAVMLLLASAAVANAKEVLPFVENDYSRAVTRAKAGHLPLFIDAWAPW